MPSQRRRTVIRLRLRRIFGLLLTIALYFGGRWGWDALRPGSPARWRAHMHAAVDVMRQRRYTEEYGVFGYIRQSHSVEHEYLAAIDEARRMRHGKALMAESQFRLAQWYDNHAEGEVSPSSIFTSYDYAYICFTFERVREDILTRHYYQAARDNYDRCSEQNPRGQFEMYVAYAGYYLRRYKRPQGMMLLWDAQALANHWGNDPRSLTGWTALGDLYIEIGRFAEAGKCYCQALAIADSLWQPNDWRYDTLLRSVETAFREYHQNDSGMIGIARRIDGLYARRFGITNRTYGRRLYHLACSLEGTGNDKEAIAYFKRALAVLDTLPNTYVDVYDCVNRMAETFTKLGRTREAEIYLLRRVASNMKHYGSTDKRSLWSLGSVLRFYEAQNMPAKAKVIDARIKHLTPPQPTGSIP